MKNIRSKGQKARTAILKATSELLEKTGEGIDVQIRDVARVAGVSLGAPNYYFGSKENLVKEAVSARTKKVIDRWFDMSGNLNMDAEQKVRLVTKNTARYYASHPQICRVRLNGDLFQGHKDIFRERYHNEILMPLFRELAPQRSEEFLRMAMSVLTDSFDLTFLRVMCGSYDIGFDYFNDQSRDKYVDNLVDLGLNLLK